MQPSVPPCEIVPFILPSQRTAMQLGERPCIQLSVPMPAASATPENVLAPPPHTARQTLRHTLAAVELV